MRKNIIIFNPSFASSNMYLPYFWASAKSYYEHQGKKTNNYNWVIPFLDFYNDINQIQDFIKANPPSVFGISLYVWNHSLGLKIAAWVKQEFPNCIIISGGPHQYFKHEPNWFEKMPFLDACLAGDEYGELTMCDILDHLDNLNWNNVHAVVYPSKDRSTIMHSRKKSNKRDFWWNYSAYAEQFESLNQYKIALESYNDSYRPQGILETTRGCPYSCSFCDWGGGISTKVIAKPMQYVQQDILFLAELKIDGIMICDANLGILKDRDVGIIQFIADTKKKYKKFFTLRYGGYAKSSAALPYIKKILEIEAQNDLTLALTYKISIQTLDKETLKNIDRTDVSFEEYLVIAQYLKNKYQYDAYAEIIAGLPGITPDKFYHEINVFSQYDINMCYYDWFILPETPSYDKIYRDKYLIKTVIKKDDQSNKNSSYDFSRESEIVIGSYSYDQNDYKEMHISYAWYRAFWTTGFAEDTIKKIGMPLGDFTKKFYRTFFTNPLAGEFIINLNKNIELTFENFFIDQQSALLFDTEYTSRANLVKLIWMTIFTNLEQFENEFIFWVNQHWPQISKKEIQKDLDKTITAKNFLTKRGFLLKRSFTNAIFQGTNHKDQVEDILQNCSSYSYPLPIKKLLRSNLTLF